MVLVNKLAYDIKVPFWGHNLFEINHPHRGDVVAFDRDGTLYVKRVMALPGDTIQIIDNVFYVNGKKLELTKAQVEAVEEKQFPYSNQYSFDAYLETNRRNIESPKSYHVVHATGLPKRLKDSLIVNTIDYTVPNDSYFMIGDNRNLSHDSRYFGPIKRKQVVGRISTILFNYQKIWKRLNHQEHVSELRLMKPIS